MKKILFIPAINIYKQIISPHMPLGLLTLQAIASEFEDAIDLFVWDKDLLEYKTKDSDELARLIVKKIPINEYDVIGFSCISNSFHHSLRILQLIKRTNPEIKIWLGGPHATAVAKEILDNFKEVDAIFMGESERAMKEVLIRRSLGNSDIKGIPGILLREEKYYPPNAIDDMDELPFIHLAKDFKNFLNILPKNKDGQNNNISIEVSRGCSGRCIFCSTTRFWGKNIRYKSNERIFSEMNAIYEKIGCSDFVFIGDNFGSIKNNLLCFCEYMMDNNSHNFTWQSSIKLNNINESDLDILWKGGCRGFFVGVESASQETLDKIKKDINLKHALEIIENAIKKGFNIVSSFIIGFPWETLDDINETYKLHCSMLKKGALRSQICSLCPLPGVNSFNQSEIIFDKYQSHIAFDDLPFSKRAMKEIMKYKDIFCHFGYYKTKYLSKADILSTVEAALQMYQLYSYNNE